MQGVLIHEYFGVDFEILWETVKTDLPTLVPALESALVRKIDD